MQILHTADLHNALSESRAQWLRALREEHGAVLLDAGDAISAGNVTFRRRPESAIERMNRAGYDGMALGNREYFFRRRILLHKTAPAEFPVVCANLRAKWGELGHVVPWAVLDRPEGRVGVFGLMPTMIAPGSVAEWFSDMAFVDWPVAAREAVLKLRGECEVVIALSHRGWADDQLLAHQEPELSLILGAHEHICEEELRWVGDVPVSYVGSHASHVGLISLDTQRPHEARRELVTMSDER
jgi:2',3'-cyclic-nucleotide 2'-phosphodiesterase (5'-nucleotidase family)